MLLESTGRGGYITTIKKLKSPRNFLPKQKEVMEAVRKKRYVLYSGAYGAGKTFLMCHVIIRACIESPRALCLFTSQTVPMLRDTVIRTFLEEVDLYQKELDKAGIDLQLTKKWLPSINTFRFFNDAEVLFRSADDPMKLKSLNLDFFAIDEPVDIDERVFSMLQGRLRAKHSKYHFGVMAGNPSGKANWVYQKFFESPSEDYFYVHTTTYDNKFLQREYIDSMVESYDEDYARRYIMGEWGSFEGQVYKDFSMDRHVGDYKDIECKYHIAGVDTGFRNPTAMLVIGIDNDNNAYIKEEYYKTEKTVDVTVDQMAQWNHKYKFNKIFVDPSSVTWIVRANEKGLRAVKADNDLDSGIAKCKALFANDIIHIDRSCKNLIREIESYQYDFDRLSSNLTEKPIKKSDHALDGMRYAFFTFSPWHRHRFLKGGRWN